MQEKHAASFRRQGGKRVERHLRYAGQELILGLTGGLGYYCIELAWRGTTHWTMFAAGGACLCLLQQLARRRSLPLGAAALCGAAAASGVELGVGLACRYLLHLAVWDYSALWGNVAGLVCPLYSFYWFLLCFWVLLVLRGAENLTERPLYRITKWAAEP